VGSSSQPVQRRKGPAATLKAFTALLHLTLPLYHVHSRVWCLFLGWGGHHQGAVEDGLRNLDQLKTRSHLRDKENEKSPSQFPQATRKQFTRWNSTSNANKIIMTIFMGECGGPSPGFHYRVYKCDRLCAARLPLQAAAVGWCMVIWCKLPPNMVIPSSTRGFWSHKPGEVSSRCFLTALQAVGIVKRG
jgi:hypothetical protein